MARHHRLPAYELHALLAPHRLEGMLQKMRQLRAPACDAERPPAARVIPIIGTRGAINGSDAVAAPVTQA